MITWRTPTLVFLALLAFAGNSMLGRAALAETAIDPATYTTVRVFSGALMLALLVAVQHRRPPTGGNWLSALALFAYAILFSYAYLGVATGTGALILFGAVQATMIGYGVWSGERLRAVQIAALVVAFGGLVGLLLPGLKAPPLGSAIVMLLSGVAWGIYSLRGRGVCSPLSDTAGNFLRAVPMAAAVSLAAMVWFSVDAEGVIYAVASGALTSGLGYAIWYAVLPSLRASTAATLQLSVPVIATIGGVLWLSEEVTLRLVLASVAILGGVAVFVLQRRAAASAARGSQPR